MSAYFQDNRMTLYNSDSLNMTNVISEKSIDVIFADPPYFLSNDGLSVKSGKFVSVNKGDWDRKVSEASIDFFNENWLEQCEKVLKDNGTLWISGTHHNIYSIGHLLINNGWKILNNITWYKPNASPNLSCRYFTHSNEQIIWAKKDNKHKHKFNYEIMKRLNNDKQMRDVWEIPLTPPSEKKFGNHPTQKPLNLLKRIVLSSSDENDIILDPFNGSGTTGISAVSHNRKYIGFDIDPDYLDITVKRYKNFSNQVSFDI